MPFVRQNGDKNARSPLSLFTLLTLPCMNATHWIQDTMAVDSPQNTHTTPLLTDTRFVFSPYVLLPKEHIFRILREKRSRIVLEFMSYEMLAKCFRCRSLIDDTEYLVTVIKVSSNKILSIRIAGNYKLLLIE